LGVYGDIEKTAYKWPIVALRAACGLSYIVSGLNENNPIWLRVKFWNNCLPLAQFLHRLPFVEQRRKPIVGKYVRRNFPEDPTTRQATKNRYF